MKKHSFPILIAALAGFIGIPGYGCSSDPSGAPQDAGSEADVRSEDRHVTPDVDAGDECSPHDVSGFTPPAGKRTTQHVGACSDAWVEQLIEDTYGADATQGTRDSWSGSGADAAHKACAACMISRETDSTFGAVVETSYAFVIPNTIGCFEVLKPTDASACADTFQAHLACQEKACAGGWCPVPVQSQADLNTWDTCAQSSDDDQCKTYADDLNTCSSAFGTGDTAACTAGGTAFLAAAKAVGKVICGGGTTPTDGGDGDSGDGG